MPNVYNGINNIPASVPRCTEPSPTYIVDVGDDGVRCVKEKTFQPDLTNYEDYTLDALVKAGVDPATPPSAVFNRSLGTIDKLNDASNKLTRK